MADGKGPEMETRLLDLETRLAFQERTIEDLSDIVIEQGKALDGLRMLAFRLRERVAELEQGPSESPQDEKPPPHY